MKIGYQGIPGSYSDMSVQDYLAKQEEFSDHDVEIFSYDNFEEPLEQLVAGDLDKVVLPVENSTTGLIVRVTDLLRYKDIIAIDEVYQPVKHTLWGLPGTKAEDIKKVYSHPEALSQCDRLFEEHPWMEPTTYHDTAGAARYIKEKNNPTFGALAGPLAGEIYGLEAIQESVQDEASNTTRFFVIEKRQAEKTYEGTYLTLYVESKHESGALIEILQVFNLLNINMTNLNARPIPNRPFQYGFLIEAEGEEIIQHYDLFLNMLSQVAEYVQIIGLFHPVR